MKKKLATKTKPSLADIVKDIRHPDNEVKCFGKQLKESSVVGCVLICELNSVEFMACKSRMEVPEKEHTDLTKEKAKLKDWMRYDTSIMMERTSE